MESIIVAIVLLVILSLAGGYVYKAKKRGQKCIGCPHSKTCSAQNSGCAEKG